MNRPPLPDYVHLDWRTAGRLIFPLDDGSKWFTTDGIDNIQTMVNDFYADASDGDGNKSKPKLSKYVKIRWLKNTQAMRFYVKSKGPKYDFATDGNDFLRMALVDAFASAELMVGAK